MSTSARSRSYASTSSGSRVFTSGQRTGAGMPGGACSSHDNLLFSTGAVQRRQIDQYHPPRRGQRLDIRMEPGAREDRERAVGRLPTLRDEQVPNVLKAPE